MKRPSIAAAALIAAAVAVGCGGDEKDSRSAGAKPVGRESGCSVVQLADCGDWRPAQAAQRYATVEALRGALTPQLSKNASSPLPDERAFANLNKTCASPNTESLRLYKLYVRMQGFAPLMD